MFRFSFFTDKYQHTHDPSDQAQAEHFRGLVPPNVVEQFLWRRQRNFNITQYLLKAATANKCSGTLPFEAFLITQDDAAVYGLNVAEAASFKQQLNQSGASCSKYSSVYPGADEVACVPCPPSVCCARSLPHGMCVCNDPFCCVGRLVWLCLRGQRWKLPLRCTFGQTFCGGFPTLPLSLQTTKARASRRRSRTSSGRAAWRVSRGKGGLW